MEYKLTGPRADRMFVTDLDTSATVQIDHASAYTYYTYGLPADPVVSLRVDDKASSKGERVIISGRKNLLLLKRAINEALRLERSHNKVLREQKKSGGN